MLCYKNRKLSEKFDIEDGVKYYDEVIKENMRNK